MSRSSTLRSVSRTRTRLNVVLEFYYIDGRIYVANRKIYYIDCVNSNIDEELLIRKNRAEEPRRLPDQGLSHQCHSLAVNRAWGRENPNRPRGRRRAAPRRRNRAEEPRKLPTSVRAGERSLVTPRLPVDPSRWEIRVTLGKLTEPLPW